MRVIAPSEKVSSKVFCWEEMEIFPLIRRPQGSLRGSFGIVVCADFHDAVDRPFGVSGISAYFAGDVDFHVFEFVDDFCVALGEAIVEADCEVWPCGGGCVFFHSGGW